MLYYTDENFNKQYSQLNTKNYDKYQIKLDKTNGRFAIALAEWDSVVARASLRNNESARALTGDKYKELGE